MIYIVLLIGFSMFSAVFICRISTTNNRYAVSCRYNQYKSSIKKDVLILIINKQVFTLLFLLSALLFSQMVMYRPGSNVSPYAYSKGLLNQILVFGRTISSWMSIVIALFCIVEIIAKNKWRQLLRIEFIIITSVFIVFAMGVLSSNSVSTSLSEGMKYLLPFLIFWLLKSYNSSSVKKALRKYITYSNCILICQVVLCKIITGKCAASTYYLEMKEEYFGFYNHPHNFTGLLGVLSIWCIYQINNKYHRIVNLFLLTINIVLMYVSGSRSYVYSLLAAIAYIVIFSLIDRNLKRLKYFALVLIAGAIIFGQLIISNIGANRSTDAFLSGRALRWIGDLQYYNTNMSLLQKIFGGGFGYVNEVNATVFGVYINSLNIFIDMLINNGIIGFVLSFIAYFGLFKFFIKHGDKRFTIVIMVYFLVSSVATNLLTYQVITIYMVLVLYCMRQERENMEKD